MYNIHHVINYWQYLISHGVFMERRTFRNNLNFSALQKSLSPIWSQVRSQFWLPVQFSSHWQRSETLKLCYVIDSYLSAFHHYNKIPNTGYLGVKRGLFWLRVLEVLIPQIMAAHHGEHTYRNKAITSQTSKQSREEGDSGPTFPFEVTTLITLRTLP